MDIATHQPNTTSRTDEEVLTASGVRITAVRLMIWNHMRNKMNGIFSLADLEAMIPTLDKSTLFRTITLFSEHHLLHCIDDGSGKQKYCVCHHDDTRHCNGHIHLTCKQCHTTYCLPDVKIPQVVLPDGFEVEEAEYVVKGICKKCNSKLQQR